LRCSDIFDNEIYGSQFYGTQYIKLEVNVCKNSENKTCASNETISEFFENTKLQFVHFDYNIAIAEHESVYRVRKFLNTDEYAYLLKGVKKMTEFFV